MWALLIILSLIFLVGCKPAYQPAYTPAPPERPEHLDVSARSLFGNECAGGPTREYDPIFRAATYKYWPPEHKRDWCWLKSQCITESNLNPTAVSPAGAKGVCQFLSGTFQDYLDRNHLDGDIFDPRENIRAGAWYMSWLLGQWHAPRTDACRRELAQASYNYGLGGVLRAQRESGGARCFPQMLEHLPQETRDYVPRIKRWYVRLTE